MAHTKRRRKKNSHIAASQTTQGKHITQNLKEQQQKKHTSSSYISHNYQLSRLFISHIILKQFIYATNSNKMSYCLTFLSSSKHLTVSFWIYPMPHIYQGKSSQIEDLLFDFIGPKKLCSIRLIESGTLVDFFYLFLFVHVICISKVRFSIDFYDSLSVTFTQTHLIQHCVCDSNVTKNK